MVDMSVLTARVLVTLLTARVLVSHQLVPHLVRVLAVRVSRRMTSNTRASTALNGTEAWYTE